MPYCKICGKYCGNNGALARHEKSCLYKKEHPKQPRQRRKLTDEQKAAISIARKKYLSEHKNDHVWKRNSKFLSIPCENLKSYLRDHNIDFIEEYSPLSSYNFSLDISWPDKKIAIEVNGNQHYNSDGTLKPYYQRRHDILEENGWTIYEVHYSKCYNFTVNTFDDILKLDIYDSSYVKSQFDKKELKKKQQDLYKQEKLKKKQEKFNYEKSIIENLIYNSGIDFSKSTWSSQAVKYLESRNELWNKIIFRCIRKYFPEFLKRDDVWIRKGSKI